MPSPNSTLICIGRLGAPHGVRGWLKLVSYTSPPDNIFNYIPWITEERGIKKIVKVTAHRHQSPGFIVGLDGCTDRDQAQQLTGTSIFIERDQLPPAAPDEYYWADLIGLTVSTLDGKKLGIIKEIFETGSNDVLVVVGEKRHLIPFLKPDVIQKIDLVEKTMQVDWDSEF